MTIVSEEEGKSFATVEEPLEIKGSEKQGTTESTLAVSPKRFSPKRISPTRLNHDGSVTLIRVGICALDKKVCKCFHSLIASFCLGKNAGGDWLKHLPLFICFTRAGQIQTNGGNPLTSR
jgi:hypothetical protein